MRVAVVPMSVALVAIVSSLRPVDSSVAAMSGWAVRGHLAVGGGKKCMVTHCVVAGGNRIERCVHSSSRWYKPAVHWWR